MTVKKKKIDLRHRLKVLHYMGDSAVGYECWKDTDENLEKEFSWVLSDEHSDLDEIKSIEI